MTVKYVSKIGILLMLVFVFLIGLVINYNDYYRTQSISQISNHLTFNISLSLFLPTHSKNDKYFANWMLPSLRLFWPKSAWMDSNVTLLIILDDETEQRLYGNKIMKLYKDVLYDELNIEMTIKYEQFSSNVMNKTEGWDRQQLIQFNADYYTNDSFVGFIDSDTVFQSVILPSSLFQIIQTKNDKYNIKPLVIGKVGYKPIQWWSTVSPITVTFLNITKEPMKCMNYFPVIIYTEDMKKIRENIVDYYLTTHTDMDGISFENVFLQRFESKHFGQFNIFCAYLWKYEHHKYKWLIENGSVMKNITRAATALREKYYTRSNSIT
eukprot:525000_1